MSFILSATEVKTLLSDELFGPNQVYGRLIPSDKDRQSIVQAIHGYGRREGIVNKIMGFIYRVFNGLKATFGHSNWQNARSILSHGIHLHSFSDLVDGKDVKVQAWMNKVEKSLADRLLDSCIATSLQRVSDTDKISEIFFCSAQSIEINAILGRQPNYISRGLYSATSSKVQGVLIHQS